MAGRPAARGGNGKTYGLIAFAGISVAALGAFIWQLTINKRLADEANNANRRLQQFGTPRSYYAEEAAAKGSRVAEVMNADIEALAQLVSGKKDAVARAMVEAADALLREIESSTAGAVNANDTLLTALTKLSRALTDTSQRAARLEKDLTEQQGENQRQIEGFRKAREEFEQQVAGLKEEFNRQAEEKVQALAAKDQQLQQHLAANDALNEEFTRFKNDTRRRDLDTEIAFQQQQQVNEDLQKKLDELRGGPEPSDILTKADGQIMRAIPGSDVVYVNLGSADNLKPGVSFEVFSPAGERVRYSIPTATGERRVAFGGKASIQVTNVMDNISECRVTRTLPERPIVEGDIVVNVAYERNRRPKFVIRGEFDLNYDNEMDADGLEKVKSIIHEWGGAVADEIDETTDFLVVGRRPFVPTLTAGQTLSTIVLDQARAREAELQEFGDVIKQAQARFVPVLNQSQFLFLTGYAGRERILVRQ